MYIISEDLEIRKFVRYKYLGSLILKNSEISILKNLSFWLFEYLKI